MPTGLEDLADGIGHTIKTIPEIYDDGLKPATKETGKTLALIPRTINAALAPLRQWIAIREYNVAETEKILAQKLEKIDPQKIVTPNAYVAIPAMQAISYSMNNEELRNLYANLLAKSMIEDSKDCIHPSFVEIIKQMSPFDAKMMKRIYTTPFGSDDQNISFSDSSNLVKVCVSVDNLIRLGLISVPFDISYIDDSGYNYIRKIDIYADIASELDAIQTENRLLSRYIKLTTFGASFYNVCIND